MREEPVPVPGAELIPKAEIPEIETNRSIPFVHVHRDDSEKIEWSQGKKDRKDAKYDDEIEHDLKKFAREAEGRVAILAEGDSWFDYPNALMYTGGSILRHMAEDFDANIGIFSLARYGQTSVHMADPNNLDRIERVLNNDYGIDFRAFLVSAGGNDIIGNDDPKYPFHYFVRRHRNEAGGNVEPSGACSDKLDEYLHDILIENYRKLFNTAIGVKGDIKLFFHSYDVPPVTGKGVGSWIGSWPGCSYGWLGRQLPGDWLRTSLEMLGWHDPAMQIAVVKAVLDKVRKGFDNLHCEPLYENCTTLIDLRDVATEKSKDWQNEIHLRARGWHWAASLFLKELIGQGLITTAECKKRRICRTKGDCIPHPADSNDSRKATSVIGHPQGSKWRGRQPVSDPVELELSEQYEPWF